MLRTKSLLMMAVTFFFGSVAFAADNSTATTSSNTEYQLTLVSGAFEVVRILGMGVGLVLITWISINFFFTIRDKENQGRLQQLDYKPVTLARYMSGLMLGFVLFFQPFSLMSLIGDVFNNKSGQVCLVLTIDDPWSTATNTTAASCLTALKKDIAGSVNDEALDDKSLTLFVGSLQLISLIFLLIGGGYFMMNMIGVRNMRITTGKSIIIIVASSALMISPSFLVYLDDLRGTSTAVTVTNQG
jgi:hypothetical protein